MDCRNSLRALLGVALALTFLPAAAVDPLPKVAAGLQADAYLEFVPSLANIADLPSRNEFEVLERHGGRRVEIVIPPAADWEAPLHTWMERFLEAHEG